MPLVKVDQINEDTKILIWNLTEDIHFFESHLAKLYNDTAPWETMTVKRKKEFLATRYLIQLGLPPGIQVSTLVKDEFGCPMVRDPQLYFGISHTNEYVACVINTSRCGCDIERYQQRILSMAHRFMTEEERAWVTGDHELLKTHLMWGIKESAFKTWGRKGIDWKSHIKIDPLNWKRDKGLFLGSIRNQSGSLTFHGGYEYYSDYLFVWSLETSIL